MRVITTALTVPITSLGLFLLAISVSFADIGTVRNFYPFSDRVLTSGQPDQAALESAAEDGIEVVINIVRPSEWVYNPREQEILERQGINYFHTPVNWRSPKKEELDAFLAAMNQAGDKKILVHCWSNARASALVYAHRVLQKPENRPEELQNLKKVWKDVAGFDLDSNRTWTRFLAEHTGPTQ